MQQNSTSDRDVLSRFMLERSGVRGVLVRLNDTWSAIRGSAPLKHPAQTSERTAYPPQVAAILGEACTAAALFTGHAKVDGRLSLQLRGTGALRTLFAECTAAGTLRGIARYADPPQQPGHPWPDSSTSTPLPARLTPRDFGAGSVLAITIENVPPGAREPQRYQGLIEPDADTLAGAFENYFTQSEQLPTRLRLAADSGIAAGLMLQQLPGSEGDADGWTRATTLFATLGDNELLRLPTQTLLWRLFHEDGVRLLGERPLRFGCSCSRERVAAVLYSLGQNEALAAAAEGPAEITCEFCGRTYRYARGEIERLFSQQGEFIAPEGLQ